MAEHFEAKKHAYRQTQDGIVISFVCHPNDVAQALALAPLGTRYMVAVAEIGDNEKPVEPIDAKFPNGITPQATPFLEGWEKVQKAKERKPFDSLPLSQQAALRCQDENFKTFLEAEWHEAWNKYAGDAAKVVRSICGCKTSRAEFDIPGSFAEDGWLCCEREYQSWFTDKQYADSRR